MKLSEAVRGFFLDTVNDYSPATTRPMKSYLGQMCRHFDDCDISAVTPKMLRDYFAYLRYDYEPKRWNGNTEPLTGSALDNHWKSIRAFYRWAEKTIDAPRPDMDLPRPKYAEPEVTPFDQEEIKKMLAACRLSPKINIEGRKPYQIKLPHADRDTAMILMLLDTGARIGEFCRLTAGDVNLDTGEVFIRPYRSSIKSRPRTVFIGQNTRRAVWKFVAKAQAKKPDEKLFSLTPSSIRHTLQHIGEKAGVKDVYPHRFRHTFAITYLRNGGDIFTLKRLLGHSTLDMVQRYLKLAQADDENAHRRASPVDNWRL